MTKVRTMPKYMLGATIKEKTYAELSDVFQEVMDGFKVKQYTFQLEQETLAFLLTDYLPNMKWLGQKVYEVDVFSETIVDAKPNTDISMTQVQLRTFIENLMGHEFVGMERLGTVINIIETVNPCIVEMNFDNECAQRASFELMAAENGILPEERQEQTDKFASKANEQTEVVKTDK